MLAFIIPIKSARISRDWARASRLFERCLRAVCQQTSPSFRVVAVCNERPVIEFTHPHVHYVEVDFPPPLPDPAEQHAGGYEYGFSREIARQNADKARKVATGLDYAQRYQPTHTMVVDADDCVSRGLAAFVEGNAAEEGWVFRRGYMYPEGGRLLYFNARNFNVICGSSVIIANRLRQVLLAKPEFYDHAFDAPPGGVKLVPLPFAGAIYSMANGDNIYMTEETKAQIHGSLLKMIFSRKIGALARKVMKYRPRLLTASLRAEFGLYQLDAGGQPARASAAPGECEEAVG